jgi:hypothetical protein
MCGTIRINCTSIRRSVRGVNPECSVLNSIEPINAVLNEGYMI